VPSLNKIKQQRKYTENEKIFYDGYFGAENCSVSMQIARIVIKQLRVTVKEILVNDAKRFCFSF
jgi:hypothetical protein